MAIKMIMVMKMIANMIIITIMNKDTGDQISGTNNENELENERQSWQR